MAASKRLSVRKIYDHDGSDQNRDWLPARAELEVTIGIDSEQQAEWRELILELASGSDELYRYYPFSSFIYVDNRLASVLEFSQAHETTTAMLRLPAGRPVRVTIATELGDSHSLLLLSVKLGTVAEPPQHPAEVAAGRDYFSQHLFPLVAKLPQPIFVLGAYRSGTSILTWALGQHPNVWPLNETGWLPLLINGALSGYTLSSFENRAYFSVYRISLQEYLAHLGQFVDEFVRVCSLRHAHHISLRHLAGKRTSKSDRPFLVSRSAFNPKRRWVDGTPENTHYASLLRMAFPAAKFVALVRNPADVIVSMLYFERAGGASRTIEEATQMWVAKNRALLLAARAFGSAAVKVVLYDRLVHDTSAVLSEIFDFLDEPQFSKASEIFTNRINSSGVSDDERRAGYEQLNSYPQAMEEALLLYQTLEGMQTGERAPDRDAEVELLEASNDLIARTIALVS